MQWLHLAAPQQWKEVALFKTLSYICRAGLFFREKSPATPRQWLQLPRAQCMQYSPSLPKMQNASKF